MTKPWADMTYDEQRAFLGLPDVRTEVAWRRLRLQVAAFSQNLTEAFAAMGRVVRESREHIQDDYALGGEK
jgi:hypothetical protein